GLFKLLYWRQLRVAMGAGCGAGRFWEAFTPLASCPAQVGGRRNIRLNGEQRNRILTGATAFGRRLVCAGREVKARLLPMRIVAALNARPMGRLYRIFSVRSIDQLMATTHASICRCLDLVHCTGRMREGEATSPRLPAVTPRCEGRWRGGAHRGR